MKNHGEDFADQLGRYRVKAGLTQQELATKISVHRRTIDNWENRASWPQSRGQVLRLADELYIDNQQDRKAFLLAAGFSVERWPTEVWAVPEQRDMFFTGRDDVFQSLRELLVPGSTTALTQAISGLGGIGKTHTAVEYAHRFHRYYEAILWLQADSWEVLGSGCMELAEELGFPEQKEANQAIAEVQHWLRKRRHWLLILDNVENPQEILPMFVPTRHQGCVLVTTRVHNLEPLAQTQVLPTMPEREGVLFLLRRTKRIAPKAELEKVSPDQYDEAKQIWQLMDGLPLALDQAGAYILETGCSFSAYREQYTRRHTELLNQRGKRVIGHEEPVTTTFSLALERVEASIPVAADMLRVCALLHNEAIPEEFFEIGAQHLGPHFSAVKEYWDLALGVLLDYSLVQRHPETKTLSLHRLAQLVLVDTMDEQTQQQWAERTVRMVSHLFPTIDGVKRQPAQRYILHAQACAKLIDQWSMEHAQAARLLHEAGSYFSMVAQYEQAEPLLKRGLEIREYALGSEHPDVAASLNNLALLYQAQGKHEQAGPLLIHALKIIEQAEGPEGPHVSAALTNLTLSHQAQGKYEQAEALLLRALNIDLRRFGPEHREVATDLNNLAELYRTQGKYEQAENFCLSALAIREHMLGAKDPHTISSYNNLALIFYKQGKYSQAESLYQRILTTFEEAYGSEHPDLATSFGNLALLYEDWGKEEEARQFYQRALAIDVRMLGTDHPTTLSIQGRYATLLRRVNEKD